MVDYLSGMPKWLEALLGEDRFFQPCMAHEAAKKNERNVFCVDCCSSLCPSCLLPHRSHRLLKIRRYVYHDVVRVEDLEKLIDCSTIQSYIANSAKVVFLNERVTGRPFRGSGSACLSCNRYVQEPNLFCSLSCKVKLLLGIERGLEAQLRECDFLSSPSACELDEGQLTPDSILESPSSTSSGSSGAAAAAGLAAGATRSTAGTGDLSRRRRSDSGSGGRSGSVGANRRKSAVPRRAPMF